VAPLARDHARDHLLVVVLRLLAPRERLGRTGDALPVRGRRRARERDDGGQELVRDLRAETEQVEVERVLCKARLTLVSSRPAWGLLV
jgi:hypothetical protein